MIAIKAHFDGENVVFRKDELKGVSPGEVILIFKSEHTQAADKTAWMRAQEPVFATAWDNDEDAVYDSM